MGKKSTIIFAVICTFVVLSLLAVISLLNADIVDLKIRLNLSHEDTKCFQRIIRHDRIFDYKNNIFLGGQFYNTSWQETACGPFNQHIYEYELRKSEGRGNDGR